MSTRPPDYAYKNSKEEKDASSPSKTPARPPDYKDNSGGSQGGRGLDLAELSWEQGQAEKPGITPARPPDYIVLYEQGGVDVVTKPVVVQPPDVVIEEIVPVILPARPPDTEKTEDYQEYVEKLVEARKRLNDLYWRLIADGIPRYAPLLEEMRSEIAKIDMILSGLYKSGYTWDPAKAGMEKISNLDLDPEKVEKALPEIEATLEQSKKLLARASKLRFVVEGSDSMDTAKDIMELAGFTSNRDVVIAHLKEAERELDSLKAFLYTIAGNITHDTFDYFIHTIDTLKSKVQQALASLRAHTGQPPDVAQQELYDRLLNALTVIGQVAGLKSILLNGVAKNLELSPQMSRTLNEILAGNKEKYEELYDWYESLKKDFHSKCTPMVSGPEEGLTATGKYTCTPTDFNRYLEEHGFPLSTEAMELLSRYYDYYDRVSRGENPQVSIGTKAKWKFEEAMDKLNILVDLGEAGKKKLHEIAESLRERARHSGGLEARYLNSVADMLDKGGSALPFLGAFATGALLGLATVATGGTLGALIGAGLLAGSIAYTADQLSDPYARKALEDLIDRAKKGDREAQEALGTMLAMTALMMAGGYLGAKAPYIGLKALSPVEMNLREYARLKFLAKLTDLAEKFREGRLANERLYEYVTKLSGKLASKMGVSYTNIPVTKGVQLLSVLDERTGKLVIASVINGEIIPGEKFDLDFKPGLLYEVEEKYNIKGSTLINKYIELYATTTKDISKLKARIKDLENLLKVAVDDEVAEKLKANGVDIKSLLKAIAEGKAKPIDAYVEYAKEDALVIPPNNKYEGGQILIYTGDPSDPFLILKAVQKPVKEGMQDEGTVALLLEPISPGGANWEAVEKLVKTLGVSLDNAYEALLQLSKPMGLEPGAIIPVDLGGDRMLVLSKGRSLIIATRKGVYIKTIGDKLALVDAKTGRIIGELTLENRPIFERDVALTPDNKFLISNKATIDYSSIKTSGDPWVLWKFLDELSKGRFNRAVEIAERALEQGATREEAMQAVESYLEGELAEIVGSGEGGVTAGGSGGKAGASGGAGGAGGATGGGGGTVITGSGGQVLELLAQLAVNTAEQVKSLPPELQRAINLVTFMNPSTGTVSLSLIVPPEAMLGLAQSLPRDKAMAFVQAFGERLEQVNPDLARAYRRYLEKGEVYQAGLIVSSALGLPKEATIALLARAYGEGGGKEGSKPGGEGREKEVYVNAGGSMVYIIIEKPKGQAKRRVRTETDEVNKVTRFEIEPDYIAKDYTYYVFTPPVGTPKPKPIIINTETPTEDAITADGKIVEVPVNIPIDVTIPQYQVVQVPVQAQKTVEEQQGSPPPQGTPKPAPFIPAIPGPMGGTPTGRVPRLPRRGRQKETLEL